jgi:membrane protease YdiL (CAAX protease family)
MLKRILFIWIVANFGIAGLASWLAGRWYLGWGFSPVIVMLVELGLIILPDLILPVLVLRYWWPDSIGSIKEALGWRWHGWRSLLAGLFAFATYYFLVKMVVWQVGDSIPYNLPGASGESIAVKGLFDILKIIGLLASLSAFIIFTVAGEETMFRGWIQTQVGKRYGVWAGLCMAAILFGLRHLPADFFYGQIWQATPQMWLSRQLDLYLGALCLGLARHFGKSTYASAMMHGLLLVTAIFGLG